MTKTLAMRARGMTARVSLAAQQGDEFAALPLGQPADGLRRGDPALVEQRLALTRPYFGTARSMSKTFAVSTYSGGSSRIVWMFARFAFRSFFDFRRAVI